MRIVYFVTEDWYFWSHRLPLAREAKRQGWDVHVLTRANTRLADLEAEGFNVHHLDIDRSGLNPLADLSIILKVWRAYRAIRPDIVHHVALKPVLYGSLAARLAQVPTAVNALAGLGFVFSSTSPKARLLRPLVRRALHWTLSMRSTHVIVQNADDLRTIARISTGLRDRITLIPGSGVDATEFSPSNAQGDAKGGVVVGLAARLTREKGVPEFAEAARRIRARWPERQAGPAPRFVLIGEPDIKNPESINAETLESWASAGDIELWGLRKDMPEVLRQLDIFCLPSTYGEGLPKCVLEAAATGIPTVTTDSPGCRDSVIHGETGLIVPPRDVDALVVALENLCVSQGKRSSMGKQARRLAEGKFAVERVVDATFNLYERARRERASVAVR